MKRAAWTTLSGGSFLLCLVLIALWIRSYYQGDIFQLHTYGPDGSAWMMHEYRMDSVHGGVGVYIIAYWETDAMNIATFKFLAADRTMPRYTRGIQNAQRFPYADLNGTRSVTRSLGFDAYGYLATENAGDGMDSFRRKRSSVGTIRYRAISFPYWAMACAALTISVISFFQIPNRKKTGHCSVCGYDLRATPDRCPECGTAPANI